MTKALLSELLAPSAGDVDLLAWEAVVTPSLDAYPALEVLTDLLLEQGKIKPPWTPSKRSPSDRDRRRSRQHTLRSAWEWAKERTKAPPKSMVNQIKELMDRMSEMEPYPAGPVLMSRTNYNQLKEMLDAGVISLPQFTRASGPHPVVKQSHEQHRPQAVLV